jgi:hypothetical protein
VKKFYIKNIDNNNTVISIKSGNIIKYNMFKNRELREFKANSIDKTNIFIKIYISKKRSCYYLIINSLVKELVDHKFVTLIKSN